MYLTDLTRNSFESGTSATKWLGLCKLLIAKIPPIQLEGSGQVASNLSNSVLVLYRSYPGDPGLQDYLKTAIQDGILPVYTFVSTLLQAARSTDLHMPATLDTLCRIALDAHFLSGKPTVGSIVPFHEPTAATLNTVQDGLVLLRTAFTLPISHFHQLTTSVSELVILLLSCIGDMSQVSTTQALGLFAEVNDLLTTYRLSRELRQDLDNFVLSLSLLIGDDVKAAREAQILHTMQFTLGKGDILGPSSETDMITLGLLLNYMITDRAYDFGAGDSKNAVALLVATFRWSSWSLHVFYSQLLLSAFSCVSQSGINTRLWKAFVAGRLPTLLSSFVEILKVDNQTNSDLGGALLVGLTSLFQRPDVLGQANSRIAAFEAVPEEETPRSFSREFLQQLIKHNLLTQQHASQLDPMVSNESPPKWHVEAHDLGQELSAFMESKLIQDNGSEADSQVWIDKIGRDAGSHSIFARHVCKRFFTLATSLDVDALGQICKVLHSSEIILDIVALHEPVSDLIFHSAVFLEDYDCETVGDPQTAVSHLGDVVLFLQYVITRFKFQSGEVTKNNRTVSLVYLTNNDVVPRIVDRQQEEFLALQAWYKELFDKNSEGIEDNILRSTKPKTFLRITPALFVQTIGSCNSKKMDKEVLMNGVSYFTGPLLNWTLVGIIKVLVREIQQRLFVAPTHYEIIQLLLQSPSCPRCVLELCSPYIMILLSEKKRQPPAGPPNAFNVSALRQSLGDSLNLKGDLLGARFSGVGQIGHQQVQQDIQKAFSLARSHKLPFLDIRTCLTILPPIKFLLLLWTEIVAAASLGELEACRRIATFVLTSPQGPGTPPLLPLFLHIELPLLISTADMQQTPEQTMTMELLVAIISSVLNAAAHLEIAMRFASASGKSGRGPGGGSGVSGNEWSVLGQSSAEMTRRLAFDLRRNRASAVSGMIVQRLSSSQSFVANFPAFISEGI